MKYPGPAGTVHLWLHRASEASRLLGPSCNEAQAKRAIIGTNACGGIGLRCAGSPGRVSIVRQRDSWGQRIENGLSIQTIDFDDFVV